MPERLLAAVHELTETVGSLEEALKQYPKRQEVENRFATKHESKRRAFKVLMLGLSMMLIALIASFFVTVGTVTTCFISDNARNGNPAQACHLLPGFEEAQEESLELRKKLKELIDTPDYNSKRLDRIENELGLDPLPE